MRAVPRAMAMAALAGAVGGPASLMLASGSAGAIVVPYTTVHSDSSAGWSLPVAGTLSTFSVSMPVTAVTCPASGVVYMVSTVFLQPSTASQPGVTLGWQDGCNSGTLTEYGAYVTIAAASTPMANAAVAATAGQHLAFTVAVGATTGTKVVVRNTTTKTSASVSVPTAVSIGTVVATTAFFVPGSTSPNVAPIPTFTDVPFNGIKVNGSPVSDVGGTRFVMYDGTTRQVYTTLIGTSGSFKTVFKNAG